MRRRIPHSLPVASVLALVGLCCATGVLRAQTVRAYLSYDARGLERRPVLRDCSAHRTPYVAPGALVRRVDFTFTLDSTGKPQAGDSLQPKGQPLPSIAFQTAALEVLRSCRFEPAHRAGHPVAVPVTVTVQFPPRDGDLTPELARQPIRGIVTID